MVDLSIENLRTMERYLKMAYRVVRAASYSTDGGLTPNQASGFDYADPGLDITAIRTIMANSSSVYDAASNVLDAVSDYIQ